MPWKCDVCGAPEVFQAGRSGLFCQVHAPETLLDRRNQELREALVRVTRETPYPDELEKCRTAQAALIAEVGTLRARVAELERGRQLEVEPIPRVEVVAFAQVMETKLLENDHKGGWDSEDELWLCDRLEQELKELREAVKEWRKERFKGRAFWELRDRAAVIAGEAADVGNFAMMLFDKTRPR